MNFIDDDLAIQPPFEYVPPPVQSLPPPTPVVNKKVVAAIPVFGRHSLVKLTISRLLNRNGCHAVVCAGGEEDRKVCEDAGAIYIEAPNTYLGVKWNAAFMKARRLQAEAVLFMGSSDWVSDNWIPTLLPHLDEYDMVGKAGCYFLDIKGPVYQSYTSIPKPCPVDYRLAYWPGYKFGKHRNDDRRDRESIGIGRLLSAKGLDKVDWQPFHNHLNNSLDYNMFKRIRSNKIIYDANIKALSISTDLWNNKHRFADHWEGLCPSKRIFNVHDYCKKWFPEYNKIIQ